MSFLPFSARYWRASLLSSALGLASVLAPNPARAQLAGWQSQTPPLFATVQSLDIVNDSTVWVSGPTSQQGRAVNWGVTGNLFRSTDRGTTWERLTVPRVARKRFRSSLPYFCDGVHAVYLFEQYDSVTRRTSSDYYRTADAGQTWTPVPAQAAKGKAVSYVSSQELFQTRGTANAVARTGRDSLYHSTNGGQTFSLVRALPPGTEYGVNFLTSQVGVATVWAQPGTNLFGVARTTDGGQTWQDITPPGASAYSPQMLRFADPNNGIIGLEDGAFITHNGGQTWLRKLGGLNYVAAIADAQHAITRPMSDVLSYTTDGGTTWQYSGEDACWVGQTRFTESEWIDMHPSGAVWVGGTVEGEGIFACNRPDTLLPGLYYSSNYGATFQASAARPAANRPLGQTQFATATTGWSLPVGDRAVLRTTDRGLNWQRLDLRAVPGVSWGHASLSAGAFPDPDSAFVVGQETSAGGPRAFVLRTTTAGQSWQRLTVPSTRQLTALAFYQGARRGLAVGGSGTILLTTDGGQSWSRRPTPNRVTLRAVSWADAQTAFAVGDSARLFKSTDGGASWAAVAAFATFAGAAGRANDPLLVQFRSALVGFVSQPGLSNGPLARTTDGGLTWAAVAVGTSGSSARVTSLSFWSAQEGWATCPDGLYQTANGGQSWSLLNGLAGQSAGRVDQYNGWVGAPDGGLYRYSEKFIRTGVVSGTGNQLTVPFSLDGAFSAAERSFQVELSNAQGRFRPGQTTRLGSAGAGSPLVVTLPATLPNGTAYRVRVVRADGSVLGSDNGQNLLIGGGTPPGPAPTITSFSPASGLVGTAVVVTGQNLTGATSVTFGGITASSFTVNSATQLTATVPAGAASGPIGVSTPNGMATSATSFTVVTPSAGFAFFPTSGAPGSVVLVTGSGFGANSAVRFNGAAATGTEYQSATQLTATVPVGASTGLLTASTGGATLTGTTFSVTAGPAPLIRTFSPSAAPVGTVITLDGANFSGVTGVRFGTVPAPGFAVVSATRLTVPVPAGAPDERIYVLTSQGMAQSATRFALLAPPTLTAMLPNRGTPGAQVLLTGTNLTNTAEITFGGVAAALFTVNSATQLTATVPAGALTGPIGATTVAGTAATAASFTVTVPAPPTIGALAPMAGAVGMTVVVTGTNLTGATVVRFNNVAASGFTVNSATQLTATVPAGATTGKVSVLTPGGLGLSAGNFTVVPVPLITGLAPATGSAGALVQINGRGLGSATSVRFSGSASASFTVAGAGLLATVPAGATSGPVQVITPGGTATSPTSFSVTAPAAPAVAAISPATGPVGTTVTLTGTGFGGTTAVRLGSATVTSFTVVSPTQLTLTVPVGAISGRFFVEAAGGLCQSTASFAVLQPPTITALLPTAGTRGSTLVIRGTNLASVTALSIGGAAVTGFTATATQLTATVPNGASSGPVTVTNPAGTAASAVAFTVTLPPPPTITALSAGSGPVGTRLTLTGTNFVNVTRVLVSNGEVLSYAVNSATSLTLTVPATATSGLVAVVADGGLAFSPTPFTLTALPEILVFTPTRGPVGTLITLTGKGLTGASGLTVGGTPISAFTVHSATKITATVPNGAATGQVSVTTPIATSFSAQVFTLTTSRPGPAAPPAVSLNLYPNPASRSVTVKLIDWPRGAIAPPTVKLFDNLGRQVRTVPFPATEADENEVSVEGLLPGIYTVRCGPVVQQLLVQP